MNALPWLLLASTFSAAPKADYFFPAGISRGQTTEVTVAGSFDQWPPQFWAHRPGLKIEAGEKKGQLKITADPQAERGVYWIRLYDKQGGSSPRPLLVDALPSVAEKEPNNEISQAQAITTPAIVEGRLHQSKEVDGFRVTLKKGQQCVAALQARQLLGSPMDAVLQVCDARGFVLQQNDDARGLDPLIVFTAAADGDYLVRLFAFPETPNSSIQFSGGGSYVYRLTLTTQGFADYTLPLALPDDQAASLRFQGWDAPPSALTIQPGSPQTLLSRFDVSHPQAAETLSLPRYPFPVLAEKDDDASSMTLPVPCSISGRLLQAGEQDIYRFSAKAKQRLTFRLESRRLGYPLDAVLQVRDAEGKQLTELDDSNRLPDPELTQTFSKEGRYELAIRDLHGRGGTRYAYRIAITEALPDFTLTVAENAVAIDLSEEKKKTVELEVTINRQNKFSGEIEIRPEGLPPGAKAETAISEGKGDSAKKVKLKISAEKPLSGSFWIVGQEKNGERKKIATYTLTPHDRQLPWLWLTATESSSKK